MTDARGGSRLRLEVSPASPCLDTVLDIRLDGLVPGSEVTLRATQPDSRGCEWRSAATFAAAADGTVDLSRDVPLRGSYQDADPMGLVWSMEPSAVQSPDGPVDFLAPARLRVVAEAGGVQIAATQCSRRRVPAGLCRTDVREDGLVGTFYVPEGEPRPGVLLVGGSEGGMHEDDAALLAAHGFAALALAYYGMPGLPATLQDIPLEYFGRALDYLHRHDKVSADRLAVIGASKGGEAALVIGATFPQVSAVVSVVGSGLITQGISQNVATGSFLDILDTPVASWTYQGRELPYLPNVITPELENAVAEGAPVALRLAFEPGLLRTDMVAASAIAVERIHGAVLLISGSDDQGYGPAFHDVAAVQPNDRVAHTGSWCHVPSRRHSPRQRPRACRRMAANQGVSC